MEAIVYFTLLALASIWAAFWLIRIAVRAGVNDALRMNRSWLSLSADREDSVP